MGWTCAHQHHRDGAPSEGWTPSGCCSPEGTAILELLAREDETLLVRGDALLVLDLGLDSLDGVSALHLKGDSFSRQRLDEDLHLRTPESRRRDSDSPC